MNKLLLIERLGQRRNELYSIVEVVTDNIPTWRKEWAVRNLVLGSLERAKRILSIIRRLEVCRPCAGIGKRLPFIDGEPCNDCNGTGKIGGRK